MNWNTSGKVTPTKDQGTCGDCWAFATTATFESYLAIKKNILYDLSEEYLLECCPGGCTGGSLSEPFTKVIKFFGMPTETSYPYKAYYTQISKPTTPGICLTTNKILYSKYTTSKGYYNLTRQQTQALVAASPLAVSFASSGAIFSYKTGVYSCRSPISQSQLNHAVTLIGYDSSGNWLIKNSWGKGWGIGGLGWIRDDFDCGIKKELWQFS